MESRNGVGLLHPARRRKHAKKFPAPIRALGRGGATCPNRAAVHNGTALSLINLSGTDVEAERI
jgi:hypothetical protein